MRDARASDLQAGIVHLTGRVQEVDIRQHEQADAARLRDELLPRVVSLTREAVGYLDAVLDSYEPGTANEDIESTASFFRRLDLLVAEGTSPVADLAFIARSELVRKLATLSSVQVADTWRVIDVCGSCLRKIRKGLGAVEAALCEHEHLAPVIGYTGEVAISLAVRRTYAKFRREILCAGSHSQSVADCLHSGATSIAKLIGRDVYSDLRISDRVEIRKLQERTVDWLSAGADRDVLTGLRLWQDLCGFANLLAEVNKRQELLEHDRTAITAVRRLLAEVPSRGRSRTLPPALRPLLDSLFGRDDELDDLLLRSGEPPRAELEPILARLGGSLLTPILPPCEPGPGFVSEDQESEPI
jgi:hypothetical protein